MKLSAVLLALLGLVLVLSMPVLTQEDAPSASISEVNPDEDDGEDQAAIAVDNDEDGEDEDDASPNDEAPEEAAVATGSSSDEDDDDDDDEDDEEESPAKDGDVLASSVEATPCGCKGRVKNPGDEFPFDVKCSCDIEKPDYGRLPSLKVSGQTELNGLAYLG
jgi:hypothetical protein